MFAPDKSFSPLINASLASQSRATLQALKACCDSRPTFLVEWSGLGLSRRGGAGHFYRLLQFSKHEESCGQFRRADFLWRQLDREFTALGQKDTWSALGLSESASPAAAVAQAVLVDGHLAAHDAWSIFGKSDPAPSRVEAHLRYLLEAVRKASLNGEDLESVLGSRLLARVDAAAASADWKSVDEFGTALINHFPERSLYRLRLATFHWHRCLDGLKSCETAIQRLGVVKSATTRIEDLRRGAPYEAQLYDYLADLYLIQAAQEANTGNVTLALLACCKASYCDHNRDGLREIKMNLDKLMTALQQQAKETDDSIQVMRRMGRRVALTPEGLRIEREAKSGLSLADEFSASAEGAALKRDATIARARWFRTIDHGPASPENDATIRLEQALGRVFASVIGQMEDFDRLWTEAVAANSELADIDGAQIRKLALLNVEAPEPAPAMLEPSDLLVLHGDQAKRQRSEPFGYWLFSDEWSIMKISTAAALIVVLLLIMLSVRDDLHRNTRDEAYRDMELAMLNHNYAKVIDNAARFLRAGVLSEDPREAEVRESYGEALVRWSQDQSTSLSPSDTRLLEYRRLNHLD